ncbi:MAG: damage-inducible protein DinB [Ignavibacteriae bacterium]|nr:damage-inducible protein DinB [Ignavibacteriota bacterium]
MNNTLIMQFVDELNAESPASRKCLERTPVELFGWKPHETSMQLGYLALLVAEIPRWISVAIEKSVIDFETFGHFQPKSTAELVAHFDENVKGAINALQGMSDDSLVEMFFLKNKGQTLFSSSKKETVSSSINHLVHHRGQLTVYMRLNNIPVPSIYGPSADERVF